ncbi:LANO_0H00210g1_1 [Lachancea nothofagi CBS 11611]|uniref:LANO_0H00210g1_1 n=1 Tax=Lachancea nothofagi CBS 11611 TaxID=1266666 RepID=A0A1G4KKT7_9SACH|nr:LANO_0H00210g1_1 [Lachancea nothofagi CBS 11611]
MTNVLRYVALSLHSTPVPLSLQVLMTCVSESDRFLWKYNDEPESSYYSKACGSYLPYMQTAMNCYVSYIGEAERSTEEHLIDYQKLCNTVGDSNLSVAEFLAIWRNGTQLLQKNGSVSLVEPLTSPITLPSQDVSASLKYVYYTFYNFSAAFNFSVIINAMIGLFIVLATWANYSRANGIFVRFVRSKLLVPAIFNTTHQSECKVLPFYKSILPTRGEAIAVAAFLLVNGVLALYNYPLVNSQMDSKLFFLIRCVANRTGGLSFGLIPASILLAGRNNLIQKLTGMPYSSCIFFHKWVARTMTLYASIHALLWTIYGTIRLRTSFWYFFANFSYWRWGAYATIAAIILIFHSIHSLKAKQYEIFLVVHITLVIIFLVGCLKHCAEFGWLGWIYIAIGMWAWDRFGRIWRLLFKFGGYKNAYAQVVSTQDELFRITIPCVDQKNFGFFPGCYAFIYFQNRKWFWQSHPFTLMKAGENIEIIVRAKKGLTRELFRSLPTNGTRLPLRIALEGPYGHEAPLKTYTNTLLVTSGAGIPGPLSYLQKATENAPHFEHFSFVWIVPTEAFLETMQEAISRVCEKLREAHCEARFNIHVYVTRPQGLAPLKWLPREIKLNRFKPNIQNLVQDFCETCCGSTAVLSCANSSLDDLVRRYVSDEIFKRGHRIDYYDELQVW